MIELVKRYYLGNAPYLYPEDGGVLLLRLLCAFWGWSMS